MPTFHLSEKTAANALEYRQCHHEMFQDINMQGIRNVFSFLVFNTLMQGLHQ